MSRAGRSAISPPLRAGEGKDGPPSLPLEKRDKDDASRSEKAETKEKRDSKDKEKERLPSSSSVSDIDADVTSARQQQFERAHHRALASDAGQIVKLNVGGTRYFTTKVR